MSLLTREGFKEKIAQHARACERELPLRGRPGTAGNANPRGGLAELARRTGYPYRTLQKWASGKTMPGLVKIGEIFEKLETATKQNGKKK